MASDVFDVLVIGAGAAGLMAAIECGKRGRRTLVLEKSRKPCEKIRISGGGRCNFTNLHTTPQNFLSENPRFCISALKRFTQFDFIELVQKHDISFHEKTLGQLFCNDSSRQIIDLLLNECNQAGVKVQLAADISSVRKDGLFKVNSNQGNFEASSLIVASGGKSIPKMGATSLGYDIAAQFGLSLIETRPALVPFTFSGETLDQMKALSGLSVPASVSFEKTKFSEALLFTHRGLSGPAILQISSYWKEGEPIHINLLPDEDLADTLITAKQETPKTVLGSVISRVLPNRLAKEITGDTLGAQQLANCPDRDLRQLAARINQWRVLPGGTEGYRTAEVTRGGVDTNELSSKTMEARNVPGLYFIGEVVDVTGHLGGFNFQWAWSSGFAAGQFA